MSTWSPTTTEFVNEAFDQVRYAYQMYRLEACLDWAARRQGWRANKVRCQSIARDLRAWAAWADIDWNSAEMRWDREAMEQIVELGQQFPEGIPSAVLQGRTVFDVNKPLIIHPREVDDRAYLLAYRDGGGKLLKLGWLSGKDAKADMYRREVTEGRPVFVVPAHELRTDSI